jgi:hypothetical protein
MSSYRHSLRTQATRENLMNPLGFVATTVGALVLAGIFGVAQEAEESPSCIKEGDDAAIRFASYAVSDPAKTPDLLHWASLNQYRQRTQQLMDDQYSPGSKDFRERRLGPDWTFARLKAATNKEFAEAFFAAEGSTTRVKDVAVLGHTSRSFGDEIVVGYTVIDGPNPGPKQRILNVRQTNSCWTVEVPQEAWHHLDEIAVQLKATRANAPPARLGPSSISLRVKQASFTEVPGMNEARQRGVAGPHGRVWLSTEFVLSETDVESATAASGCNVTTQGLEEPTVLLTFTDEGAERLRRWSSANMGRVLAVTVGDEPIVVAKVAGVLGKKLSMCLKQAQMSEANLMARQLMGWQK